MAYTIILIVCFPNHTSTAQERIFEKITVKEGLSHSTVYDIAQDEYGVMWFGTREGLNSFDGNRITTFKHDKSGPGSLSDSEVNAIRATHSGLLVGTYKGLDRYVPETHRFERILHGVAVSTIFETPDSTVFAGTQQGLFKIEGKKKTLLLEGMAIQDMAAFRTNVFWVALHQRILLINNMGEVISEYSLPESPYNNTAKNVYTINTLFKDSEGTLWMGTSHGLFYFDTGKDRFNHIGLTDRDNIEAEVIRSILEDTEGNLWLGTESGIFVFDRKKGSVINYTQSFNVQPETLSDKSVYSLFQSRDNIIWAGTYFGGVNYTMPGSNGIRKYMPGDYRNSINGKAVSQITGLDDGTIWIGTEDGGVSIFHPDRQHFDRLTTRDGLSSNNVHAIEEDGQGNVWIGTFLGGINRYDKKDGTITVYKNSGDTSGSLSNNYVYAILQDRNGTLWAGTQYGLNTFDYGSGEFHLFMPGELGDKFVYDILEDRRGNLWFCTRHNGVYQYLTDRKKLVRYTVSDEKRGHFISAYEDSGGTIWFGTLNDGLFRYDYGQGALSPFMLNDRLPNKNTYGMLEDDEGRLWISTNSGISVYTPGSTELLHLEVKDGLSTNQFNFKSFYRDARGRLYFGSINGLNVIDPGKLNVSPGAPGIRFTGLQLFNKAVPIDRDGVLKEDLNYVGKIVLKHNQNVLGLEYNAIDYLQGASVRYAYKLDGFDENWNRVGTKNNATYTNLEPGDYVFRVRTLPFTSVNNEKQVQLTILPPFWKSNGAYALYTLLCLLLIYAYWRFVRFVHAQKLAVQMERLEKEKIRELNQHKLNFFTFISHEFKTPLTLIIASVEKYFKESVNRASPPEELLSVKRGAEKLNQLIFQLLEFRKIETDHARLELRKGDIILFLRNTFDAFTPLFSRKEVKYTFKSHFKEYHCYFDPEKVEMIVANLISNALKNTPAGGTITLQVAISTALDSRKRSLMDIDVTDNGNGMSPEQAAHITEPFYRTDGEGKSQNTGLGLALVKSLTGFLEGSLHIASEPGEGTKVNVRFPLLLKAPESHKIAPVAGNRAAGLLPGDTGDGENTGPDETSTPASGGNYKIIIAEDNTELMRFLQKHFSRRFNVIVAKDGMQVLEKMKNNTPDLIVSDVKMPELNGIDLCKRIKSNPETRYIPFVLLTAKDEEQLKLDALAAGANAYLSKPFNLRELELLIKNLLETGKNLENRFSPISGIKDDIPMPANNRDREFLRKIVSLVEANYQDPKFGVETLADRAGISRSLLHLKMKQVTGLSASGYIKRIRMKKACRWIRAGKSISEVAYNVGYSDPNYFSRAFKKEFGQTPSRFAGKQGGGR
ncbi:hybrid sensor histidine kinase/response regulator transcription factor [Sinomicrobium soli]|uniref:hybrid sensor histidine kinase/response regulator transcription factor n=1 Tax=Sinomicrobium sp. N-1-3-6 TaxID=2219864 RepID=UPI001374A256|nr:hybrid sensor histidine kinase/response regulator transcription factor [Sinomicrobium sp. N-1-3-6]